MRWTRRIRMLGRILTAMVYSAVGTMLDWIASTSWGDTLRQYTLRMQPVLTWAASLALLAHLGLVLPLHLWIQTGAALMLVSLLPGLLLVEVLLGPAAATLPARWERSLYAAGAGYALMVTGVLLLVYLPGPLTWWQILFFFDAITLVCGILVARRHGITPPDTTFQEAWGPGPRGFPSPPEGSDGRSQARRWLIAGMLVVALAGGFMRLTNLYYTEFQGDETRVLLRTAEAIQGYTTTLFTHKKGPGEIITPAATYVLTGHIDEAAARLPFAFANLAGLFAVFLLGWRLFGAIAGPLAGWIAAMVLALDGYFIGFGRLVQYQSIVFLMVTLVMLVLFRLVQEPNARLGRHLLLAALFLATGLLAHYEAVLVAIPALYLLYAIWRQGGSEGSSTGPTLSQLVRSLALPVLIGGAILAVFYVPFVFDPSFASTFGYITVNRIGGTFPYNNLVDVFERTTLYSTSYYFVLMTAAALGVLTMLYWRGALRALPRWLGWAVTAVLWGGVVLTFWRPTWLTIAGHDATWTFFVLATAAVWFLPFNRSSGKLGASRKVDDYLVAERVVWLWFGALMILMLFFTLTPNTHVYGFFIPWALLAGLAVAHLWRHLVAVSSLRLAQGVGIAVAALLILLFGNYAFWYFVATNLEVLRTWRVNRPAGYWISYDMPTRMSIFGFPLKNGWKAVGALYADGILGAPFDLHGKEPVADWYTRGVGYCPRDHLYYIWHESVEPVDQGYNTVVRQQIEEQGYQLFATANVNGQSRLRIYKLDTESQGGAQRGTETETFSNQVQAIDVEEVEARFDQSLSGPIFENDGPAAESALRMQNEVNLHLGESIRLRGYRIETHETTPGDGIHLTLYWRTVAPVSVGYSVFTQIIDMSDFYKAGQRDGEPVCNTLPTDVWRMGDTIVDRYYIPIDPAAPPGDYALLVGMYDHETGERLDIFDPQGQPLGDAFNLTTVSVGASGEPSGSRSTRPADGSLLGAGP